MNWSAAKQYEIGDWGFDRPGYPRGLYLHGVTVAEGRPVNNPVIYDNDVYDDVFDDELVFVMASLGEMRLAGLIVTPVLTDFWGFSRPEWIQTAIDSRGRAEASGLRMDRIPRITVGSQAASEKAAEGVDSPGARLYVRIINDQYRHDPSRPVLIGIGGQGATLASAFQIDPSIAMKCIVYYTDIKVYNGHYSWASELIARHFRVVSWGDDHWWIPKRCQNEWRVLPRPEHCEPGMNHPRSGEWARLTDLDVPLLHHMVKQFRERGEYASGDRKADAYGDGTFLHAWLPGIFGNAELREIRRGTVLHITQFGPENEDRVKAFTLERLLNPRAYGR